jgi:hypothetical protein
MLRPARRSTLARMIPGTGLLLACAVFGAACSSIADSRPDVLPEYFSPPATSPWFTVSAARTAIEKRILASECASTSVDVSGLGLMTRPETRGGVYLDSGTTVDGTRWFLHRNMDDPDITYCGIALVGVGTKTNVSVTGVSYRNLPEAKAAVESGDFLCKCKRLAQ